MAANEDGDGRARGPGGWPDDVSGYVIQQFADYYAEVRRSLRAAAIGWAEAGRDERAAYIDEFEQQREAAAKVWATHVARPMKEDT